MVIENIEQLAVNLMEWKRKCVNLKKINIILLQYHL